MAAKNKNGFRTVAEADEEDYRKKIKEHRLKIMKRTTVTLLLMLIIGAGLGLFMELRHYEDFDVTSTLERADTEATRFEDFGGNILKYSNDGAFYTDTENELIWSQTYEMSMPQIDICGDYLTIYDKKGTMIYILTAEGLQGSIETTMPINQVSLAAQGTIAVLMQKDNTGYLALYDKDGTNLAQGAIHGENSGYPIAIALSQDAIKLAVSLLDIQDGTVKSAVAFYNFGSVGQNEIDNCVGVSTFSDTIIPELEFVSSERMIGLSDTGIVIFEGTQKPQLQAEIPIEKQAKTIFYNEKYVGIVTANEDEAVTHHIAVYDMTGKLKMEKDIENEYENISFLSNNEICILKDNVCDIYTIHGIYKFHYEFDGDIHKIIPGVSGLNYTFVLENATEKVRLK